MAPSSSRPVSTSKKSKTTKSVSTIRKKKSKSKRTKKSRSKYSDALKAICYRGALSRKPPAIFKCPHCGHHTVRTVVAYAKYIAGHWYCVCANPKCNFWHMPKQESPPQEQIDEIEEQRELDDLLALNGMMPGQTDHQPDVPSSPIAGPSNVPMAGPTNVQLLPPVTPESQLPSSNEPHSSTSTRTSTSSQQLESDLDFARRLQAAINEDLEAQGSDDEHDQASEAEPQTLSAVDATSATSLDLPDEAHAAMLADEDQAALLADAQSQSQRARPQPADGPSSTNSRLLRAAMLQEEGAQLLEKAPKSKVLQMLDELNDSGDHEPPSSRPSPVVTPTPAPRSQRSAPFPMEQLTPLSSSRPARPPHERAAMSTGGRPPAAIRARLQAERRAARAAKVVAAASAAAAASETTADRDTRTAGYASIPTPQLTGAASAAAQLKTDDASARRVDRTIPQKRARAASESSIISISSTEEAQPVIAPTRTRSHVQVKRERDATPPISLSNNGRRATREHTDEESLQSSNKENHAPDARLPGETHVCDTRCEEDEEDLFAEGIPDDYNDLPRLQLWRREDNDFEREDGGQDIEDDDMPALTDISDSDDDCECPNHPRPSIRPAACEPVRHGTPAGDAGAAQQYSANEDDLAMYYRLRHRLRRTRGLPDSPYDISCPIRGSQSLFPRQRADVARAPWESDSDNGQDNVQPSSNTTRSCDVASKALATKSKGRRPASTAPAPPTTEPASATTAPASATTAPPSAPTAPPSATTEPHSATTAPPSAMIAPPPATTAPVSATIAPPPTTTAHASATTAPASAPTAPPSATTEPHSATSAPPSAMIAPPPATTAPASATIATASSSSAARTAPSASESTASVGTPSTSVPTLTSSRTDAMDGDISSSDDDTEGDDDIEDHIAYLYAPYVVEKLQAGEQTASWSHDFDKVMSWMLKIYVWTMDGSRPKLHELPIKHTQDSILLTDATRLSILLANLHVRTYDLWDPILTAWKSLALNESIFVCEHIRHTLLVRLPSVSQCGDFAKTLALAEREGTAWTPGPSPAPVDDEPALRLGHHLHPDAASTPRPVASRKGKEVYRG